MKLRRKQQRPQATDGPHLATLCDVTDMGIRTTSFGEKHNVRLLFLLDESDPKGEPLQVSDIASASAHESSKLTGFVRVLLGDNAPEDFDTEDLIGKSCELTTKQELNSKGQLFAQITGKRALKPGHKGPSIPLDFVRGENRPTRKPKVNGGAFTNVHGVTVSDEDVPC